MGYRCANSGELARLRHPIVPKKSIPKWNAEATNLLKGELKRRGIGYKKLALLLLAIDVVESERSITSKLSRGGFPFTFYLQCMKAIGRSSVTINLADLDISVEPKKPLLRRGT